MSDGYEGPLFPTPVDPGADEEDLAPDEYPITSWVTVDGIKVPCTPPELRVGQPTILDGLTFGWGRDTSVDQSEPNTCSFTLREELEPRHMGENQVLDPTFSDPEKNATRFLPEWPIDGGEVIIGGPPEQVVATNRYTDPGVEFGSPGWGTTNTNRSIERNTEKPHQGTYSIKTVVLSTSGSISCGDLYGTGTAAAQGLKNGDVITLAIWVWQSTAATSFQARAWIGGAAVAAKSGPPASVYGQWTQLTVTNTIIDATQQLLCRLYLPTGADSPANITTYADDVGITHTLDPVDFNGSTPAADGYSYRWTGTPGSSTSEKFIPGGNADSYRVWLIGDKIPSTSAAAPPNPAPENGAIPVVPGQVLHLGITATASVDREARYQLYTYNADGEAFGGGGRYVASNTPLPAGVPTRVEGDWVVPDDGTAYVAVAFVPEGGYGGTVRISEPDFYFTGGAEMLDVIHVGSGVQIWCQAEVPISDANVMDPNLFTKGGIGPLPAESYTRISGDAPEATAVWPPNTRPYVTLKRTDDWDWNTTLAFPPLQFDITGEDPSKWDLTARITQGTTWYAGMDVRLPPGVTATLKAWAYSGPEKADLVGEVILSGANVSATGAFDQFTDGRWDGTSYLELLSLDGEVTLPATMTDPAGYWIAVGLELTPMPSPTTWAEMGDLTWRDITLRWIDLQQAIIYNPSLLQAEAAVRTSMIWSGEVTNLVAQAAGDFAYTINVTASDLSSILANVKVGDQPWPSETLGARAAKIMALIPESPPLLIDDSLESTIVSYRDVDAQPPLGLLQDLAQSAGGVLWITAHATQGAYLWMEDPRNREAVRRFVIDPTTKNVSISTGNDPSAGVAVISAMDILRDPVNWVQDTSQVITQVSVSWLEQVPPVAGEQATTIEHTEIVRDTQDVIDRYGVRDLTISTELTSSEDALELAARLLALSRGVAWRASGLEYDTILLVRDITTVDYSARLTVALDLLDATTRIGYAFTMVDMPTWTPAGAVRSMYVEGGTYTWERGRWNLSLSATPSAGQGSSARWIDFANTGVTWENFRPNKIRWLDAYGTEGPITAQLVAAEETSDV